MIKWLIRLSWIFGTLGLAGTIIIVVLIFRNKEINEERQKPVNRLMPSTPQLKTDTTKGAEKAELPATRPEGKTEEEKDTILPGITPQKSAIISETPSTSVEKKTESTPAVNSSETKIKTPEAVKEKSITVEKQLTQKELKGLAIHIKKVQTKHKLKMSCVQIYRTKGGNNKKASSQIENYLRNHSFSIAGRETIEDDVTGIKLSVAGQCIRLKIGKF